MRNDNDTQTATRVAGPTKADISYRTDKPDPKCTLDVYQPPNAQNAPVAIFVHGGAWHRGDKANMNYKPQAFMDEGYTFVSANYRLVPDTDYKGQASDLAHAIAWVKQNIDRYGGNPDRVLMAAHSAGAHLVALMLTDERYLEEVGLPLNTVRAAVLLDGAAYDIPAKVASSGPRSRNTYRKVFGTDPRVHKAASPITYVARDKGIPAMQLHYCQSRGASKELSERFADALKGAGITASVLPAAGKTHETINKEFGKPGDAPTAAAFKFLKQF